MSKWWILRLIWLTLGLLTGVIVVLPESAEILTGIVALIFILATLVILGRWAVLIVPKNSNQRWRSPTRTSQRSPARILPRRCSGIRGGQGRRGTAARFKLKNVTVAFQIRRLQLQDDAQHRRREAGAPQGGADVGQRPVCRQPHRLRVDRLTFQLRWQ